LRRARSLPRAPSCRRADTHQDEAERYAYDQGPDPSYPRTITPTVPSGPGQQIRATQNGI
ncbi:MAG TPA: hypothetical protein VF312_03560, partial [Propionibacteriaceae bacterium]